MAENFEAIIGANIRDFQRAMREVDQQIRETAMGAEADIGADISEFMSEMSAVESILTDLAREHDISIDAEVADAVADVVALDAAVSALPNNVDIDINADISDVVADVAVVQSSLWALTRDRILIPIETRVNNFQRTIGRIANFTRSFQELQQTTSRGIMISLSPALVPLIASLSGLIGNLGPMIGVLGGSTFALASAFGVAGAGAVAFGAVAVTHLKEVFGASSELKKLQEELGKADTLKERNKILKEMKEIQSSLNAEQVKAMDAMSGLKSAWSDITKDLQTPTLQIFTKALSIFGSVLTSLKPMFEGVTNAFNRLMDSLGKSVSSESMVAFFNYLNATAGPMTETVFKSIGNLFKGFFSMMVAFGPLAETTSAGFLKMSEGFASWAAGLGESKKFQSFVDYVNTNMPKVRAIFRDAFAGITYLFAAFAPSSAGMMTSLQDMMARFKEWASTLGQNQQFQAFIDYIKTNGPQVVALIGNITTFLVNFGIALAPIGSSILDIVNGFLVWSSAMLENHPWLGKILAAVIVLGGAFIAIVPNIVAVATLFELKMVSAFAKFIATVVTSTATFVAKIAVMIAQWVLLGAQALIHAAKVAAAWLLATGQAMVTAVASMIATSATFVAKWLWMGAQAILHGAKVAAAWALSTGAALVTALATMLATSATFVAKWLWMGAQALVHAAKVAAAWLLSTGAALVTALATMVSTSATFVAKWLWMGVQALLHAGKMAAAWFIALGPVGWVIGAVVGLAILIIANWDKVKEATVRIWKAVSDAVKEAWESVKSFASKMVSAGADLVEGLIKGIISKASGAVSAIKETVGKMVDAAKSLLKINSPSIVFTKFGQFVSEGLSIGVGDKAKLAIRAVTSMASAMTNAFAPQLAMPGMDLSMNRIDVSSEMDDLKRQIKQELSVDMSVNHRGGGQAGGGITQKIIINSPTPLTESEVARKNLQVSRQLAMEWGV